MYWLGPVRYGRFVVAAFILAVGVWAEFRPTATQQHPFAATDVARGEPIEAVEWRRVPKGLLPMPELSGARAVIALRRGEPILPSHLGSSPVIPADWWSITVAMPFAAPPGSEVQLVRTDNGSTTTGIVIEPPVDDPLSFEPQGLVAVPAADAAAFGVAAASGEVTVLIAGN